MSELSGMILVSCEGTDCKSLIKKAEKIHNVVSVLRPRDKNDIDVVITLRGTEESIKKTREEIYNLPEVTTVECSIY